MNEPKYRRVLLKISGEALAGDAHRGLNFDVIGSVCDVVKQCVEAGVQVGIVVGGGNFWRGIKDGGDRMERTRADQMGMLATVINCLALADSLEQRGVEINADAILLAKNVDGVYSDDPAKNPDAVKFDEITYDEVLARHLMVMDSTATSLSMDNHIPIILFALKDPENILRVVMGEKIGTVVKEDK